MINRLLIILGVAAAILAVCLCARRGYSGGTRYVRYTSYRYSRYSSYSYRTYGSSGGGGAIAGYVVGGIVGCICLAALIYCFLKHHNKKRQVVQPRRPPQDRLAKHKHHNISGPMVQPPPYPGPHASYPHNAPPPGFSPAYMSPPPPYSQATVRQPMAGDPAYPPPPPLYNPAPVAGQGGQDSGKF